MDINYTEFEKEVLDVYHDYNNNQKDIWERVCYRLGIDKDDEIYLTWFEKIMEETCD